MVKIDFRRLYDVPAEGDAYRDAYVVVSKRPHQFLLEVDGELCRQSIRHKYRVMIDLYIIKVTFTFTPNKWIKRN